MADVAEEAFKVVVVGDGNVGKTSLLRRFVRGDFVEQYRRTVGAEFLEKDVYLRTYATTVRLMLWDTAGQEMFSALTQAYYRGAGAAVVAFSSVDRASFEHVATWKARVEHVCGPITMVLCQTKMDLVHDTAAAAVTRQEAEQLAEQLHIPFFRVSTKDDFNVTQLFEFVAEQCMTDLDTATNTRTSASVAAAGGAAAAAAAALPRRTTTAAALTSTTEQVHSGDAAAAAGAATPLPVAARPLAPATSSPGAATAASTTIDTTAATTTSAVAASPMPGAMMLPAVLPTPTAVLPVPAPTEVAAPASQRRVRLQETKQTHKRKRKRHFKCSVA